MVDGVAAAAVLVFGLVTATAVVVVVLGVVVLVEVVHRDRYSYCCGGSRHCYDISFVTQPSGWSDGTYTITIMTTICLVSLSLSIQVD